MTENEWLTLGIAGIGFLVQGAAFLVRRTRDLENIKHNIDEERLERTKALAQAVADRDEELAKLVKEWNDNQRAQDNAVGEMGLSLRRFIEGVEKEMHKIELWGRDNYVQKPELDSVRNDIRLLGSSIKELVGDIKADLKGDIKEVKDKIEAMH